MLLASTSPRECCFPTMDKRITQGRLSDLIISTARDVFPDPEAPAMPMIPTSAHGGE